MRRLAFAVVFLLVPTSVSAQFHLPLPPALGADTVCVVKSLEQNDAAIGCAPRWSTFGALRGTIQHAAGSTYTRTLISRMSLVGSDAELREYYRTDGLNYFQDFTATVREDRVYVATSLLAGLLGRTYFDFSVAKMVAAADEGAEDPQTFEDGVSNVNRLINNGGSAAMHILLPIYAGGGTVSQRAFGLFLQAGGVGPLDNPDDMVVTAGFGAEFLGTMAVRDSNYALLGELFFGLKAAYQHLFDDDALIPGSDDRTVPYLQLALGIRQASRTVVAFTYTAIEDRYREFMPRVQLSIQMSPGG